MRRQPELRILRQVAVQSRTESLLASGPEEAARGDSFYADNHDGCQAQDSPSCEYRLCLGLGLNFDEVLFVDRALRW